MITTYNQFYTIPYQIYLSFLAPFNFIGSLLVQHLIRYHFLYNSLICEFTLNAIANRDVPAKIANILPCSTFLFPLACFNLLVGRTRRKPIPTVCSSSQEELSVRCKERSDQLFIAVFFFFGLMCCGQIPTLYSDAARVPL